MDKKQAFGFVKEAILVPFTGLAMLAGGFFLYFISNRLLSRLLERLLPLGMFMGLFRWVFLLLGIALAFWLIRRKLPSIVQAGLVMAGTAAGAILLLITLWQTFAIGVILTLLWTGLVLLYLKRRSSPWFLYYGALLGLATGLFYGWPV